MLVLYKLNGSPSKNQIDELSAHTELVSVNLNELTKEFYDETYKENENQSTQFEIHRAASFEANMKYIMNEFVLKYIGSIFGLVVFVAVMIIGFKSIENATNPNTKEHVELMESFKNIFIGTIIVACALTITTISFDIIGTLTDNIATVKMYKVWQQNHPRWVLMLMIQRLKST